MVGSGRGWILQLCKLCFDSDDMGAPVVLGAEEHCELIFSGKTLAAVLNGVAWGKVETDIVCSLDSDVRST